MIATGYILYTMTMLYISIHNVIGYNILRTPREPTSGAAPSTGPGQNASDSNDLDHLEKCPSPEKEFVSPMRGSPRCCRTCEPGTGMLRLCTDSEDTQCIPCEPGAEYSLAYSATGKCRPCRRCQDVHPLAKTRRPCTPTTDTECQCVAGYYMDIISQACKACTSCRPDEGVLRPCTWDTDTQCESCPTGFLSAKVGDTIKCVPCRTCTEEAGGTENKCSFKRDPMCCSQPQLNCTSDEFMIENPTLLNENLHHQDSGPKPHPNQMLPIYCSIMGLIIVFLLLYVVYKLWRQREAAAINGKLAADGFPYVGCNGTTTTSGTTTTKCHKVVGRQGQRTRSGTPSHKSDQSVGNGGVNTPSHTGQERDPLLPAAGVENYKEKPLKSLQPYTLGCFAVNLAREDWKRLAAVLKPVHSPLSSDTESATYNAILQAAAVESRATATAEEDSSCSKVEENLSATVAYMSDLCADPSSVTVGCLTHALHTVGFQRLIPTLLATEAPANSDLPRPALQSV